MQSGKSNLSIIMQVHYANVPLRCDDCVLTCQTFLKQRDFLVRIGFDSSHSPQISHFAEVLQESILTFQHISHPRIDWLATRELSRFTNQSVNEIIGFSAHSYDQSKAKGAMQVSRLRFMFDFVGSNLINKTFS